MAANDEYILELLTKSGLISADQAVDTRLHASENGMGVEQAVIQMGLVSREDILRNIANDCAMDFMPVLTHVDEEAVNLLTPGQARRYRALPFHRDGNSIQVAICDPLDFETLDSLRHLLKQEIDAVVVPREEIDRALSRYYGAAEEAIESLIGAGFDDLEIKERSEEERDHVDEGDAPIIRMAYGMILDAHRLRASDIHVEPLEKRLRLRYRIDGKLQEMRDPPKRLQSAIISRIKLMANMSLAEKRLPQDGRIAIAMQDGKALDLRVSTIPTVHGESVVMRILDKSGITLGLPELGFLSDDQMTMEKILGLADGIFLVTGPTGSGKSTTLYACLNSLNRPDRKLITVENPVEYEISGINQVGVNEDVGMTFAAALRSMLRQAPNIIMVGEIRDSETAQIAINASLTGHLVFSTLHTNDAPSAVTRLIDIGVKPFLVSSSVRAVMAQRLVRRICKGCASPHIPEDTELRMLNINPSQASGAAFKLGRGCDMCRGTGFRGRCGIFEIFIVDDEIRHLINDCAPVSKVRQRARDLGMRTLREDGVRKVVAGITTATEIIRATMGDKD